MIDWALNKIICGDCLRELKRLPDACVQVVFADPPFNLKKNYKGYYDNLEVQDYVLWCKQWIGALVRITKPSGSILLHNIPKWLSYYAAYLNDTAYFRHWITWEAPTAPMGKTLQPAHYGILFYTKTNKSKIYELRHPHKRGRDGRLLKDYGGKKSILHPFGPLISDIWTDIHRIRHSKFRDSHPCQLPVILLERLLLMTTDEGDIVLDPFIGTGTTAIAAKKLNRRYIGIEHSNTYVNIA